MTTNHSTTTEAALEPCPLSHYVHAGLSAHKTGLDPRIVCLDCGLTLRAPDWIKVYERWQSRPRIPAPSVAPVVDDGTRRFDVKWRRPHKPEVLECHDLTAELLVFRIRAAIRMSGSVELLNLTPREDGTVSNHVFTCSGCGRQWTVDSSDLLECFFIGLCYWCIRQHRLSKDGIDECLRRFIAPASPVAPVEQSDDAWTRAAAANLNKENWLLSDATPEELDKVAAVIQASIPVYASGDLISRSAAKAALCYMCADPERYKPAQPIEGSMRLFHFQGSSNWNAGQCFAQAIESVAASPASPAARRDEAETTNQVFATADEFLDAYNAAATANLLNEIDKTARQLLRPNRTATDIEFAVDYIVSRIVALRRSLPPATTPPSTLAKTIIEALTPHIDPYFRLNRDWQDQIAAIIERCFSGGGEDQNSTPTGLGSPR